jgi:hypothetical protein
MKNILLSKLKEPTNPNCTQLGLVISIGEGKNDFASAVRVAADGLLNKAEAIGADEVYQIEVAETLGVLAEDSMNYRGTLTHIIMTGQAIKYTDRNASSVAGN